VSGNKNLGLGSRKPQTEKLHEHKKTKSQPDNGVMKARGRTGKKRIGKIGRNRGGGDRVRKKKKNEKCDFYGTGVRKGWNH